MDFLEEIKNKNQSQIKADLSIWDTLENDAIKQGLTVEELSALVSVDIDWGPLVGNEIFWREE